MDERTLWRFKTCAITITSPNQQGREGADSEEVWILTGKSVILLNRSSLNHGNSSLFPFKEAYFYACSLPARTSLRISWESGHSKNLLSVVETWRFLDYDFSTK